MVYSMFFSLKSLIKSLIKSLSNYGVRSRACPVLISSMGSFIKSILRRFERSSLLCALNRIGEVEICAR